MLYGILNIDFAPLAGLLFLAIFLISNKETDKRVRQIFTVLCILEFVELLVYSWELWTAAFVERTGWRILLSALGYSIRPMLVLCILCLSAKLKIKDKKTFVLAIPAVLNMMIAFSAFFTDIAYSYTEANEFVRGPLGYVPHVVMFFYLLCILFFSIRRKEKRPMETAIIWAICLILVFAIVCEVVFSVRSMGRTAIVLSTLAYYLYFQTITYREGMKDYMEQTIRTQKDHIREMNIIGVLAKEYVTVCYVDSEKDVVTPYRMDPFIEEHYGDSLRSGVRFEDVFQAYVINDITEEDQEFFLNLADLGEMLSYLRENGSIAKKYRVWRDGKVIYCEMRVELVKTENGTEDIVFGFSNSDARVHREMVYQSAVEEEFEKVQAAKDSLSGIAKLAGELKQMIEENLAEL